MGWLFYSSSASEFFQQILTSPHNRYCLYTKHFILLLVFCFSLIFLLSCVLYFCIVSDIFTLTKFSIFLTNYGASTQKILSFASNLLYWNRLVPETMYAFQKLSQKQTKQVILLGNCFRLFWSNYCASTRNPNFYWLTYFAESS